MCISLCEGIAESALGHLNYIASYIAQHLIIRRLNKNEDMTAPPYRRGERFCWRCEGENRQKPREQSRLSRAMRWGVREEERESAKRDMGSKRTKRTRSQNGWVTWEKGEARQGKCSSEAGEAWGRGHGMPVRMTLWQALGSRHWGSIEVSIDLDMMIDTPDVG